MSPLLLCSLLVGVALGAELELEPEPFICPAEEPTGRFEDPYRCDIYWECRRGSATLVQCDDGYVYDPARILLKEPCDYSFNVNCEGREQVAAPKGYGSCPRLNGVYPAEDENDCSHYISCISGVATTRACSPGLHFNNATKTCDWPAIANRGACTRLQSLEGVVCDPKKHFFTPTNQKIVHPTFPHPKDCELFITCKNGEEPLMVRCDPGLVFNEISGACDDPINVPECGGAPLDYDTADASSLA